MREVLVLGATGSIGVQALDVIGASEELVPVGLSAGTKWPELVKAAREHGVGTIALRDEAAGEQARGEFDGEVLSGDAGIRELVARGADVVLNGIVGSAGLGPTIVALTEGLDLALANKESLVVGGELVMALSEATGGRILPVDSEHSALFQLIAAESRPGTVERLVLTASGGPFRGRKDLSGITREEALDHPTWDMGGKISIDCATLMNKGLEMIEAHHLFGVAYRQIDIVVHPQSIVHSLIQLNDGATMAHLGYPDMRVPISYALNHPARADVPVQPLDLAAVGSLDFEPPDPGTFRCLTLAREAGEAEGTAPCVLNAANEVAVEVFLEGDLSFTGIAEVVERTLDSLPAEPVRDFEQLFACDAAAREAAREAVAVSGAG